MIDVEKRRLRLRKYQSTKKYLAWRKKYRTVNTPKRFTHGIEYNYYMALHYWVRKQLGSSSRCDLCNTEDAKKYEWANISGNYKKELTDWIRLCTPCHKEYDKT